MTTPEPNANAAYVLCRKNRKSKIQYSLWSLLIDPRLGKKSQIDVELDLQPVPTTTLRPVMTPFSVAAIEAFFELQADICAAVEASLMIEGQEAGEVRSVEEAWKATSNWLLNISGPMSQTEKGINWLHENIFPELSLDEVRKRCDESKLRYAFNLEFNVRWDNEHGRSLRVEDGVIEDIIME